MAGGRVALKCLCLLALCHVSLTSEGSTEGSLSASLPLDVREYEATASNEVKTNEATASLAYEVKTDEATASLAYEVKTDEATASLANEVKTNEATASNEVKTDEATASLANEVKTDEALATAEAQEEGISVGEGQEEGSEVSTKESKDNPQFEKIGKSKGKVDGKIEPNIPLREILLRLKPPSLLDDSDEETKKQSPAFNFTNSSVTEPFGTVTDAKMSLAVSPVQEKNQTKTKSKKAACSSTDTSLQIQLLNATSLQGLFSPNPNISVRNSHSKCAVVFFFSNRCKFSVTAAPFVNMLRRSLEGVLSVYAVDSRSQHSINAHFGVMGTPVLSLFHGGNSVAYYNASTFSIENLANFFNHYTDLTFPDNATLLPEDYQSDILPLKLEPSSSLPCIAAWLFLLSVAFYCFVKSNLFDALFQAVLASWREAEAHQHQD